MLPMLILLLGSTSSTTTPHAAEPPPCVVLRPGHIECPEPRLRLLRERLTLAELHRDDALEDAGKLRLQVRDLEVLRVADLGTIAELAAEVEDERTRATWAAGLTGLGAALATAGALLALDGSAPGPYLAIGGVLVGAGGVLVARW